MTLADAQFVLAREYGFESWAKLVHQVEAMRPEVCLEQYARLAEDLLKAYNSADLEQISFYGCPAVTNAGVVALARLPRLRELHISGPQITRECAAAFPAHVRVEVGV